MTADGSGSPLERSTRATLESLVPGARIDGLLLSGAVEIQATRWIGDAVLVTFTNHHGDVDQRVIGRSDEATLRVAKVGTVRAFDGDGQSWRLAAEALRIRFAATFDSMLALSTSDLQPLPHQIQAVYGELLPRTPLRYLLADDPGAGKTIMCGLYIKELMLRGDLARCMIVAPGSLVDQWLDELYDKFGLKFEALTRSMIDASIDGNVFDDHPLLVARMDQLSRNDDLIARLEHSDWDLIVVDEAHRMSASYFGTELKTTKRYQLGKVLGQVARHFLLMTATPHSGKHDSFQLFLALLDGDRFEGRFRDGIHSAEPGDLMRRMVKEDLLTMEGKPLFPERRAYTVPYDLSDLEKDLYEAVTLYVREEMNRADRLKNEGDGRRGNTVGFALTVLQRRLASSPEAILRSLQRRRSRLEKRKHEMSHGSTAGTFNDRMDELLGRDQDELDARLDDFAADEIENFEEDVVDAATAARTIAELDIEVSALGDLVTLAERVRWAGTDRKWTELRSILTDHELTRDAGGNQRKIIVFTENRDTLNYLVEQIRRLLGRHEAVVSIHGGVKREERRTVQEQFTSNPSVVALVATDAAGEGLNLQRAHLMVNYDLPWNPNRIEQRFGRIHRIGQQEVCHLWNLVANDTREGMVFHRLLEKIEQQREAYSGKVFDVLGDAFENQSLRSLLVEAIRYGDQPAVRQKLETVIDSTVGEGLDQLLAERALHQQTLATTDVEGIRRAMEQARALRLQPHFVRSFFKEAFALLGGQINAREHGRYEITHVPASIRDRDRIIGTRAPVLTRYERVTFDRESIRLQGSPTAQLLAPGHPLLDAVVDLTVENHQTTLSQGAVLIDPEDSGETPRLLVALTERIVDGHEPARTVSKRFAFIELGTNGEGRSAGVAPYLDYDPAPGGLAERLTPVLEGQWLAAGAEETALAWAMEKSVPEHRRVVTERVRATVAHTRAEVHRRLRGEINHYDTRHAYLLDLEAAGKNPKSRPERAFRQARDLEARLQRRDRELAADEHLSALPPNVEGSALVIPKGLLERLMGQRSEPVATYARETTFVERRAVEATLAAERRLGRQPEEMPHNNKGFDIRSTGGERTVFIEVKGRIAGADDFTITHNEVLTAKNLGDDYRLVIVEVSPDGPEHDQLRYVLHPFDTTGTDDFKVTKMVMDWRKTWSMGGAPQ